MPGQMGVSAALLLVIVVLLSGCVSPDVSGNVVGQDETGNGQLETKLVTKIIDGDTVIVEGGDSVRLLGIDTDERGYPCYSAAKDRLEELVLNREAVLEREGEDKDQYGRYLRYILLDDDNVNVRMVSEGYAVARLDPDNVRYRDDIIAAEKSAMSNGIGCKWSGTASSAPIEEDIALEEGVISACQAGNYIGQETTAKGKVAVGYKSRTGTIFLNFGGAYPDQCFTATIFASDAGKFPPNPNSYYEGKTVKVSGKIKLYEGKPEIILEEPSQITIAE